MPSLPSGSGPSGCFDAITSSILKIIVATSVALLTACVLTLKGSNKKEAAEGGAEPDELKNEQNADSVSDLTLTDDDEQLSLIHI